jgi:SAM-dependent methyltransferase
VKQKPIPIAFDAYAGDYDSDFTYSILGRLLRARVWEKLRQHFAAGQHMLELACGTGEDAVWLAKQDIYVVATDGSGDMLRVARTKTEAAGVSERIAIRQVSLQQIAGGFFSQGGSEALAGSYRAKEAEVSTPRSVGRGPIFDGIFSNFGGLNTIGDWRSLAKSLSKIIKAGGKVILVPMGPLCPWEIAWYVGHGQPKAAFRRFGGNALAQIGPAVIPIWYPSAKRLRVDFAPWFEHRQTESLGLWLPPSYLDHFVDRWPRLFAKLSQFEQAMAYLTKGWGDHYIIIFQRRV